MGQSLAREEDAQEAVNKFVENTTPVPPKPEPVSPEVQRELDMLRSFFDQTCDIFALAYVFSFIDTETLLRVYVNCFEGRGESFRLRPGTNPLLLEFIPLGIEQLDIFALTKNVSRFRESKDESVLLKKRIYCMFCDRPPQSDKQKLKQFLRIFLLQKCSHLKYLKIPMNPRDGLGLNVLLKSVRKGKLTQVFSDMKRLTIDDCDFGTAQQYSEVMSLITTVAPYLETLYVYDGRSHAMELNENSSIPGMEQLRHFCIKANGPLCLHSILQSDCIYNLHTLEIATSCLQDNTFRQVVDKCSKTLVHLMLRFQSRVPLFSIDVFSDLPLLERLEILSIANYGSSLDEKFEQGLRAMKDQLKEINFLFTNHVTEEVNLYKSILSTFTELQTLQVTCNTLQALDALAYLPHTLQNLTIHSEKFSDQLMKRYMEAGLLRNLRSFTSVDLIYRSLTPAGLLCLAESTHLENIELSSLFTKQEPQAQTYGYNDYFVMIEKRAKESMPLPFSEELLATEILPRLPHMRRLSLCVAYKLTEEGKQRLRELFPQLCVTDDLRLNKAEVMELL